MGGDAKKTGVILLAFGGADSLQNVEPFIKNVLKARPVPPELIEDARRRYRLIGGSSPLASIVKEQARALEEILNRGSGSYSVFTGMLNWHPFIKDTVREMKEGGIESAFAIVMSPHTTKASTGGYATAVDEALKETGGAPKMKFLEDWHTHPLYISALLETIEKALKELPSKEETLLVFSAHSLPIAALDKDPYVDKIKETIAEVAKRIPFEWRLGFQSKGRGGEWLGPAVEEVMKEAKAMGKKAVLVVPLTFTSDHVETLYDIDIFHKEAAKALELLFQRAPSLNTSPKFIEMLAAIIEREKTPL